jgi:hypothetical protein
MLRRAPQQGTLDIYIYIYMAMEGLKGESQVDRLRTLAQPHSFSSSTHASLFQLGIARTLRARHNIDTKKLTGYATPTGAGLSSPKLPSAHLKEQLEAQIC